MDNVSETADRLIGEGYGTIMVIPLYIAFDGPSSEHVREVLSSKDAKFEYLWPIGSMPVFKEILDSKVQAGW